MTDVARLLAEQKLEEASFESGDLDRERVTGRDVHQPAARNLNNRPATPDLDVHLEEEEE